MRSLSKSEFIWGYAASTLNIGAGIMLLPIILRFLPPQDVGLWFVFITLAGFAQLIEFGFQPTLARNTAYIYAGAQNLSKFGLSKYLPVKENINLELLNDLLFSAKKIYRTVSIVSIIILWIFGTLYIATLINSEKNKTEYILAWLAFSSGSIVNFYYGYVNGILQGRGDVGLANKVTVLSKGSLILLGAVAVASGFGLVGFGFAALFSACISRIAALHYFSSGHITAGNRINGNKPRAQSEDILKILWHNAGRLGLVQIGAFLIQRGNILIASSFLGLSTAASYGMSVTVLTALVSISAVICQLQVPHMSAMQAKGERKKLAATYGQILILSFSLFALGFTSLLVFGDTLLIFIQSDTRLLPPVLLLFLGIVLILEMHHSIAGTYLTTTNYVPFVRAAIISGLAISILSVLAVRPYGAAGLIMAQCLVQLLYNNWKWPIEALRHLGFNLQEVLVMGFRAFFRTPS